MDSDMSLTEKKIERIRKVFERYEEGILLDSELWQEVNYVANYPNIPLGINEGIAR